MTTIPYESARSGTAARAEITKILHKFGCESVGFMDNFDDMSVLLAFKHRGRSIQLEASAKGWAKLYLERKPWSPRKRVTKQEYEQKALEQGFVAVNSILRDWIKGQITAVECGIQSFDAVFMPYIMLPSGQTVVEYVKEIKLLPSLQDH